MIITTINVNGIRAASKQRSDTNLGLNPWLLETRPDVVLLQEVRASDKDAETALAPVLDAGYHFYGAPAAAKGRAGVAILSTVELTDVEVGIPGFEDSGRYIQGTVLGAFGGQGLTVASLYLPSGSAGTAKQDEKYAFLDVFETVLHEKATTETNMVIGGDWNICHREQDLKNYKTNRDKSGFLPDERAFMDQVFGSFPDETSQLTSGLGTFAGKVDYPGAKVRTATAEPQWFDVARRLHPEDAPYTWWTYRGQAFANDAGWRIDYQAATKAMLERAQSTEVYKVADHAARWSDHAPLTVHYDDRG